MRTIALTNNKTSNKRLLVLFVLLMLSSVRMFGQEVKNELVLPTVLTNEVQLAAADAQMELVFWFMGSKTQMSNNNVNAVISTNGNSGKKQFINNGMTPNRILSRAFLKKAINHDSTIA